MISQLNIIRNVRNANNGKSEIGDKTWKKNKGNNTQEEYDNKFTEAKLSGCPKERLEEMSSRENKNKTQISEQNKKIIKNVGYDFLWLSLERHWCFILDYLLGNVFITYIPERQR